MAEEQNAGKPNAGKSAAGWLVGLFGPAAAIAALWVAWLIVKAILTAVGNSATSALRDIPVIPPGSRDSLTLAYAAYAVALAVVVPMCWDTLRQRANPAVVGALFVAAGVVPAILLNLHVKAGYTGTFGVTQYATCGSLWTPAWQPFVPACSAQLDSVFQWIATIAIGAIVLPLAYVGWVTRKGAGNGAPPQQPDKPAASS